jgi:NADPH-dependent ferric siderophore reductase
LGIGGPRGSFIVPMDLDWHLLVGDATALPAIARWLSELPVSATVFAIVQMADSADHRPLSCAANVQLQWVSNEAQCLAAVRAWQRPAGEGFAWCEGEASSMAALRRVLVEEQGVERHAVRAAAYWKRDAVAFHENLGESA